MSNNNRYHQPEQGTIDWHIPINENFERLESDVEVRDTESSLSDYDPKEGAKFVATDSGAVYLGDGTSWLKSNASYHSLSINSINNDVYINNFTGGGLATKLLRALQWLKRNNNGQGRVIITSKEGGSPWIWDRDLELDPLEWNGIIIECVGNVKIEYPGSGWALTLQTDWERKSGSQDFNSEIIGGRWFATGEATGCFRIIDTYKTKISPQQIFFRNSTNDCVGVSIENHKGWSESNHIENSRFICDIGIDFVPANVTGGSGTTSFHGTTIENTKFGVSNIGIRARSFDYSYIDHCSFFAKRDNVTLLQLGGEDTSVRSRMEGTVITATKLEDPGVNNANTTAIRLAPNYDGYYGPLIVGGKIFIKDGQKIESESENNNSLIRTVQRKKGYKIEDLASGGECYLSAKSNWPGFELQVAAIRLQGRYLDLSGGRLQGLREYNSASPSDLSDHELAIDIDREQTDTAALLYKDDSGTVHYWDADGAL